MEKKPKMKHRYLKPVGSEDSFILKTDHEQVIGQIHSLEELRDTLVEVPGDAIAFHMDNRNDFANWLNTAISCETLSNAIADVELKDNPEETRQQLLGLLNFTISLLNEKPREKKRERKR